MIVTVRSPARPVDVDTFTDITTVAVTAVDWNAAGGLDITFAAPLSADQERLVRLRCAAPDQTTEDLYRAAWTAYQANRDFLALSPVTQAQALAQVTALTRQVQNLIRALVSVDDPTIP